jgi:hypothetical protein
MMAAPGAAAAAAPVVEEKTAFDVVLEEIPADKKVRHHASDGHRIRHRAWYQRLNRMLIYTSQAVQMV